jgi:hypothetical protein
MSEKNENIQKNEDDAKNDGDSPLRRYRKPLRTVRWTPLCQGS